ncbi:hypothetical protein BH24CHL5_BH24CHL5_04230 [soil metagenome]
MIVGFRPGIAKSLRAGTRAHVGVRSEQRVARLARDVELLHLPAGVTVEAAIRRLRGASDVRYAEPDYWISPANTPDDPYYTGGQQWNMYGDTTNPANPNGSAAGEAWAAGQVGSRDVFVGIVDEGFQYDHPDLAANAWTNPYEPVDGIDNDGNGYIDDVHGWDFFNNDNSVYDGTASVTRDAHGTHVAGIVGARGGNAIGVAGVSWNVTLIAAKFLGPNGGSASGAIKALNYLTDLRIRHGLNIVATNNSWGAQGAYGQALIDAIRSSGDAGMLFVAAAGNNGKSNDNVGFNPASFDCSKRADNAPRGYDCIISVASINSTGRLSSFSNFGPRTVDLGAPGERVWSTKPNGGYGRLSGTSMAAPHVTGAIALCASMNPAMDAAALRGAVLKSVAANGALAGRTVSGGQLDIGTMVEECSASGEPVVGGPSQLRAVAVGPTSVRLDWVDAAANERGYEIQGAVGVGVTCEGWTMVDRMPADSSTALIGSARAGMVNCFRVRATSSYPFADQYASAWSDVATVWLPVTTPSAPHSVAATAGEGQATVGWSPPRSDGGSPITRYGVVSSPSGKTCATAGELSCTVSELNNGTSYTFTVTAWNEAGAGPSSGPSAPAVPRPAQVGDLTISALNHNLVWPQQLGSKAVMRLSWPGPVAPGGSYTYQLQRLKATGVWAVVGLPSPTATAVDVTVKPGSRVKFRVRATDGVYAGAWANATVQVNLLQETSFTYSGRFRRAAVTGASGSYVRYTAVAGRSARLAFSGTGIAFVTTAGPARGVAEVWLDGSRVTTLDLYAVTTRPRQVVWSAVTAPGAHLLEIRVTGARNPASTKARIDIDAALVRP